MEIVFLCYTIYMDKEQKKQYDHEYYLNHRQDVLRRSAQYQKEHPEKVNQYCRKSVAKRLRSNPEFRKRRMEYYKTWYQNHREKMLARMKDNYNPHKALTRSAVRSALIDGRLQKPDTCSKCGQGSVKIEGHHRDYDKPLEVEWLCDLCHAEKHLTYSPFISVVP